MRILGEGFRRVNAKGEGINIKAKQSKKVIVGRFVVGACISSLVMFTETPAYGRSKCLGQT